MDESGDRDLNFIGEDEEEVIGLFVGLCEQAEGDGGHSVDGPGAEEDREEGGA